MSVKATREPRGYSDEAGLAVLIAGIAIIIGAAGSAVVDWLWVAMLVGFLGMVYGVPAVHKYHAPRDGWPGKWGSLLIHYGGAVMVLLGLLFLVWEIVGGPPEEGPGVVDLLWMLGSAAFAIGVILFAIGSIKARVLPLPSGVLMLVLLLAALAIDMATGAFFEDEATTTEWGFYIGVPVFYIGVPVFALGLAWAGFTVWKGPRLHGFNPDRLPLLAERRGTAVHGRRSCRPAWSPSRKVRCIGSTWNVRSSAAIAGVLEQLGVTLKMRHIRDSSCCQPCNSAASS